MIKHAHGEAGHEPRNGSARPIKRSFRIAGHATSISLEAAFWDAFRACAEANGQSMTALLSEIDVARGEANLSSAVRVHVLNWALDQRSTDKVETDETIDQNR